MNSTSGRLSGERWNRIVQEIIRRYYRRRDLIIEELMAAEYPPFQTQLTGRDLYDKLVAMQAAGDPGYWNDKEAQAELVRLSQKYGNPPDLTVGPFGETAPNNPYYQYSAPEPGAADDTGAVMNG